MDELFRVILLIVQAMLGLGFISFAIWLVQRLTRPQIAFKTFQYTRDIQDKEVRLTKILIQNQQDVKVPGPITITIPLRFDEWYVSNADERAKSMSFIHGPFYSKKPTIEPEASEVRITAEEGMRPLATWMIICRTKTEYPKRVIISWPEGGKTREVPHDLSKEDRPRQVGRIFARNNIYYLGIWGLVSFLLAILLLLRLTEIIGINFLGGIIVGCLLVIGFSVTAFNICQLAPPSIIQGYADEYDPHSSTHENCSSASEEGLGVASHSEIEEVKAEMQMSFAALRAEMDKIKGLLESDDQ